MSAAAGATVNGVPQPGTAIFANLVDNAIKYTPDGGQILVSGRMSKLDDAPAIEITVRDTGIGIDPQHQQLVFEKFVSPKVFKASPSGEIMSVEDDNKFLRASNGFGSTGK